MLEAETKGRKLFDILSKQERQKKAALLKNAVIHG